MNIDKKLNTVLVHIKEMLDADKLSDCTGICCYVEMELIKSNKTSEVNTIMGRLDVLFMRWPEYSDWPTFPIPSYREDMCAAQAYRFMPLWDTSNEYGKCRIRCLNWLIEQTKGE